MVSQHGELAHKSWQATVLLSNQNHGIRKSPEFNDKAATLHVCYQVPTCSWNCTRSAQPSAQAAHVLSLFGLPLLPLHTDISLGHFNCIH